MTLTIKQLVEDAKKYIGIDSIEEFTCYNCKSWVECPYSFDGYNTGGDCLMDK